MSNLLALDVGSKRIGVAIGDNRLNVSWPLTTLAVDETIHEKINQLLVTHQAKTLVVGLPRNNQGEVTAQTDVVQQFASQLELPEGVKLVWQDESLTSVRAEAELKERGKPFEKTEVDALAATYILEDYLREKA